MGVTRGGTTMKQVCWNCKHCCTFAGICFKGKFENIPVKIQLEIYNCELFESDNEGELE
jgi:hypothetical protein